MDCLRNVYSRPLCVMTNVFWKVLGLVAPRQDLAAALDHEIAEHARARDTMLEVVDHHDALFAP